VRSGGPTSSPGSTRCANSGPGLDVGETAGDASFDPDSARHIAEIGVGKQDINFDDLANGKAVGVISRSDNGAASDDLR
jgi:hypothetical protein